MVAAIRQGALAAPAVSPTTAPSASRPNTIRVALTGMQAAPDPVTWSLYVGTASAVPTTLGDLTHSYRVGSPSDGLNMTFLYVGSELQIQVTDSGEVPPSWLSVGVQAYVCLFLVVTPSGGSQAIDAVMALPLVVA